MKKIMMKINVLILVMVVLAPLYAVADGPPGVDNGGSDVGGGGGGAGVPLDGGLSLLAAAGVGYGIKKYRDMKKKSAVEK